MLVPVSDLAWLFQIYYTLVLFMFHVMMCSIFAQAIHNYNYLSDIKLNFPNCIPQVNIYPK